MSNYKPSLELLELIYDTYKYSELKNGYSYVGGFEEFLSDLERFNVSSGRFQSSSVYMTCCPYWTRITFFGVESARVGLKEIIALAKGKPVSLTLTQTFRWTDDHKCQIGYEILIMSSATLYTGDDENVDDWIPPFEDERLSYKLDLKQCHNYSYKFKWIDDAYVLDISCHSMECLEQFKEIFSGC